MTRSSLVVVAALSALGLAAPALAGPLDIGPIDTLSGSPVASHLPDVFNPPSDGDSRHVCVISDKLDWYACVYVPMP